MGLTGKSLENYFKTISGLKIHHKYSTTEVEDMVPYERDMYVSLVVQYLREKNNPPPGDGLESDGGYSAMLDELKARQKQ